MVCQVLGQSSFRENIRSLYVLCYIHDTCVHNVLHIFPNLSGALVYVSSWTCPSDRRVRKLQTFPIFKRTVSVFLQFTVSEIHISKINKEQVKKKRKDFYFVSFSFISLRRVYRRKMDSVYS